MNFLLQLIDSEWVLALGWTLLHSLWQGAAIAILLALALIAMKKQPANSRYLAGIFSLAALLLAMVITFATIYTPESIPATEIDPVTAIAHVSVEVETTAHLPMDFNHDDGAQGSLFNTFTGYFEANMPFIILLYLIGVFVLTMRMLGELVYLQGLRHSNSKPVERAWQQMLEQMATGMGVTVPVVLKESMRVSSPMIVGMLKPVIFVPVGLLANLPANQVECVLAHELAHIRRYDYLVNLLQSFIEILLFFNPAVWWISSFIRTERENCCDDMAISTTGDELTLARTLASLEEWRIDNSRLALAFAGRRNGRVGVLSRIRRLLEKEESFQLPFRLFWAVAILSAGLLFTALDLADESILKNDEVAGYQDFSENATLPLEFQKTFAENSPEEIEHQSGMSTNNHPESNESSVDQISDSDFNTENFKNISASEMDTIPKKTQSPEAEMIAVERYFEKKRAELEKQMQELELVRQTAEHKAETHQSYMAQLELELEKNMQQAELEARMQARELELELHEHQKGIRELQLRMSELELQLDEKQRQFDEDAANEKLIAEIDKLNKEIVKMRQPMLHLEHELHEKMLKARTMAIEREKEAQQQLHQKRLKNLESQMDEHLKESELMQVEKSIRELEIKMQNLEFEYRQRLNELHHRLRKEADEQDSDD